LKIEKKLVAEEEFEAVQVAHKKHGEAALPN
jgi:hypothetical protein